MAIIPKHYKHNKFRYLWDRTWCFRVHFYHSRSAGPFAYGRAHRPRILRLRPFSWNRRRRAVCASVRSGTRSSATTRSEFNYRRQKAFHLQYFNPYRMRTVSETGALQSYTRVRPGYQYGNNFSLLTLICHIHISVFAKPQLLIILSAT